VKSFRVASLTLGFLGSLGAPFQFWFLAAYFAYPPPGAYQPNHQVYPIDLVVLSWDLGASLSGFSGTIISFSKQTLGGVVLLAAGTAGLLPWIAFSFLGSGQVTFTLYEAATLSWIAILLVAALLGIIRKQTHIGTAEAQKSVKAPSCATDVRIGVLITLMLARLVPSERDSSPQSPASYPYRGSSP